MVVNYDSADATGQNSGINIQGSGSTAVSGVRIFKSYPTIALDALPNGITDGRLIRFKVTANAAGNVGITQFKFSIATTSVVVSAIKMYGFTDAAYSQGISGVGSGGLVNTTDAVPTATAFTITPTGATNSTIQVPAGQTYYFQVQGTVSGTGTSFNAATTLLGDSAYPSLASTPANSAFVTGSAALTSDNNLVWSPNATTTAVAADNDWTNGYGLPGLPSSGIIQNRTQ